MLLFSYSRDKFKRLCEKKTARRFHMRVAPAAFSLIPNMSSSPFLHRLVPSPRSRPFVSYSTNECVSSIISSTSVSSIVSPLFIHFTTTSYPSLSSHSHHCHCQSFRLLAFSSLMLLPLRTSIPTPRIRETELDKTAHPHHHPPRLPPPATRSDDDKKEKQDE